MSDRHDDEIDNVRAICDKREEITVKRLDSLEASSVSHTENEDGLRKHLTRLEKKFDDIIHLEVKTVYSKEIKEQIADLKEEINILYDFVHQNVVIENNNYREVLRELWNEYLLEEAFGATHPIYEHIRKALEKLDSPKVGSARQTVKKCANCRKYNTEECPPWPTKGLEHWCTQFEETEKKGVPQRIFNQEYTCDFTPKDSEGEKERKNKTESGIPQKTKGSQTDSKPTEPEKSHALDSLLHAIAPIPIAEVYKLLKEQRKELISEFIKNLEINFLVHASPDIKITRNRARLLIEKWRLKE